MLEAWFSSWDVRVFVWVIGGEPLEQSQEMLVGFLVRVLVREAKIFGFRFCEVISHLYTLP